MLRHHIESPDPSSLASRFLRLRGWAFAPNRRLTGVRLSFGAEQRTGTYGLRRPDVVAIFPEARDDFTGFELRTCLPPGRTAALLEFAADDGEWLQAGKLLFLAPRGGRPFWLGGGLAQDLVAFQLPSAATHTSRPLEPERFPREEVPAAAAPRLAIVTPSFNQGRFLIETVNSVLSHSDPAVTYHVQDGASNDETLRQLQTLRADNFSWASESDRGQADAIVRGFARSSGAPTDLMAWINSDDFYLPGTLAYVRSFFAKHPDVDLVYGHRILVDEKSGEIGRWFLPPHDDDILRLNDFVPQETMFWRRRIWNRIGGLDASFQFAMDWDLLLRFQAAGAKIVRVPYFLACFRIHATQKTSAQIASVGQHEIDALRLRTFGRKLDPAEIENHPHLLRYLRKSAWIEFLWRRLRLRHR